MTSLDDVERELRERNQYWAEQAKRDDRFALLLELISMGFVLRTSEHKNAPSIRLWDEIDGSKSIITSYENRFTEFKFPVTSDGLGAALTYIQTGKLNESICLNPLTDEEKEFRKGIK